MNAAQSAANEGEKSSVGDKYETSRSMALIDRDIHARQLESAQKELTFIQHTDITLLHQQIETGAFAKTSEGDYFFLIGLGPVEHEGKKIYFLSMASPLGKIMNGKRAGEICEFNGKRIGIVDVM
jgi:hypothetical protein